MKRFSNSIFKYSFLFLIILIIYTSFLCANPYLPMTEIDLEYFPADKFYEKNIALSLSKPLGNIRDYKLTGDFILSNSMLNDNLILPNNYLIDNLSKFGADFTAENNKYIFSAGVNSNSDKLFYSNDVIDFKLKALFKYKKNSNSSWFFGFIYDSNELTLKYHFLPIVSYSYQDENFMIIFPLICMYNISDKWYAKLSGEGFSGLDLSMNYRYKSDVTISGCINLSKENYHISGSQISNESLAVEKNSAGIKVEKNIYNALKCGLYLGRSFSSEYYCEDDDNKYFQNKIENTIFCRTWLSMAY